MRINAKGRVTIPQEIRNQLGLLPHTEVEFEIEGEQACIRKTRHTTPAGARGRSVIEALSGTADIPMSSDEIMALVRGN